MLERLEAPHTALYTPDQREWADLFDIFAHVPQVRSSAPPGLIEDERVVVWSCGFTLVRDESPAGNGGHFVSDVFPRSAAEAAGLLAGDLFADSSLLRAGASPTSPRNEGGHLWRFVRGGGAEHRKEFLIKLQPRLVNPTDEYLQLLSDSARIIEHAPQGRGGPPARIAYLRVFSWAGEIYQERLRELLLEPGSPLASADGLVLDIRGGWGGASPEYLSLFDPRMPAVRTAPRDGEPFTWSPSWTRPVTLLVDGGSRSGKEIIAYAFRKHAIGKVVGTRTAGAVLGGRPFVLSDGSVLYLAVSDVLIDGDVRLEGVGVEPDVVVERDLPYSAGRDPQLEKAVEVCAAEVLAARR